MFTRSHGERARRHALGVLLSLASTPLAASVTLAQPAQSTPPPAVPPPTPAPTSEASSAGAAPNEAAADLAVEADPYVQLVDSGVAEFASGHWAEARLLFERAHLLRPSARTLRALGMSAFNLHSYARALCELEAALTATEQPLDASMRAHVELLVRRAALLVGRFTVTHTPGGSLSADGQAPVRDLHGRLLLDIGQHTLALRATGYAPLQHTLEVHGGEDATLSLQALPLSEPRRARVAIAERAQRRRRVRLAGLTAAAGLASGAGGLISWLRADRRFDGLAGACRAQGGCFGDEIDVGRVRRLERTAYGLAGIGASLLLTSAILGAIDLLGGESTAKAPP